MHVGSPKRGLDKGSGSEAPPEPGGPDGASVRGPRAFLVPGRTYLSRQSHPTRLQPHVIGPHRTLDVPRQICTFLGSEGPFPGCGSPRDGEAGQQEDAGPAQGPESRCAQPERGVMPSCWGRNRGTVPGQSGPRRGWVPVWLFTVGPSSSPASQDPVPSYCYRRGAGAGGLFTCILVVNGCDGTVTIFQMTPCVPAARRAARGPAEGQRGNLRAPESSERVALGDGLVSAAGFSEGDNPVLHPLVTPRAPCCLGLGWPGGS